MLEYIRFLAPDAEKYVLGNPIKAMKRASALSRFLYVEGYEQSFSDAFASDYAQMETRKVRRDEIKKMASQAPVPLPQPWADRVGALEERGTPPVAQSPDRDGRSKNLVETFLRDLKFELGGDLQSHIFGASNPYPR